jgi:AraC-like DNA-binding protein
MALERFLTTSSVHKRDRLVYWRTAISDVFTRLDCDAPCGSQFEGTIRHRRFKTIDASEILASPQHVVRTPKQIASDRTDSYFISLQLNGAGTLSQDGREAILQPNSFSIYDSTRPYELHFDNGFHSLVFQIPRPLLHSRAGRLDAVTAIPIVSTQPAGAFAIKLMTTFWQHVDGTDACLSDRAGQWVLESLAEALVSSIGKDRGRFSVATKLRTIKTLVEERLAEPELTPSLIAAEAQLSARHINRLFSTEGTSLAVYLLARRHNRARAMLADPRHDHRTIGDIAFASGFSDLAHFSRTFKHRFGESPRSFRGRTKAIVAGPRRD